MRPLGEIQRDVLRSLVRGRGHPSGYWHPGCGWYWDTNSGTIRIMEGLLKRGLVAKTTTGLHSERNPRYDITDAGRKAIEDEGTK